MTNADLIKKLQELPPDAVPVVIYAYGGVDKVEVTDVRETAGEIYIS